MDRQSFCAGCAIVLDKLSRVTRAHERWFCSPECASNFAAGCSQPDVGKRDGSRLAESDEPRTALGDAGAGGEGLTHGQHHEEANEPSTSEVVP